MAKIKTLNPATGEVIAELESASESEVKSAVRKAREAFPAWKALSYEERAHYILEAREYIRSHLDEVAGLITQENGKPLIESVSADIFPLLDLMTFFAKKTKKLLRREKIWLGKFSLMGRASRIEYQPLGVIGIIGPWNYPLSIPGGQVVMALMAGNTVVLKPSEFTPLIALKLGEVFQAVGLPDGVLQVLPGDGVTGAALVSSGVNKIIFTGSTATGKKIMEAAAKTLTPVSLELGGKDPMIVLEDADLEVASSGAIWGGFSNSGQTCAAVERVYVHEKIADEFLKKCVEKTQKLRQGVGTQENVDLGAMSSEMQLSKVEKQVEDAKKSGAEVLVGGHRDSSKKGFFYPPTLVTKVNHQMDVMSEETFGPVLGIMTFKDEEEAIRLANDSKYGLTASVWTSDMKRGERIAQRLEAGTVTLNESVYTYALPQTPWGGPKESSIGRTHGKLGLLEMVEPKHIHINRVGWMKDIWWYGYTQARYDLLVSLLNACFSKTFSERFEAAFRFLKLFNKTKNL